MITFVKRITDYFHKKTASPNEVLLAKVLECIKQYDGDDIPYTFHITPTDVSRWYSVRIANVALIPHEKIGEFQSSLLFIEDELIKRSYYCTTKLADDKSYAKMLIIDDNFLNLGETV